MVFAPQECWDKLHIVHCGVNPADFAPAPSGTGTGRASRLLFVGRLAAVKGLPILLEAVALLRRGPAGRAAHGRRRRARPGSAGRSRRGNWASERTSSSSAINRRRRCASC